MAVRELGIDCKVAVIGAGLLGLRIAGKFVCLIGSGVCEGGGDLETVYLGQSRWTQ